MSDTQLILGLGIYTLIGYGFMRGQIWLATQTLKREPNLELEVLLAQVQNNVFIRLFMTALWPIVLVTAGLTGLIDYLKYKNHNH